MSTTAKQSPAAFTLITGGNSGIGLELARQPQPMGATSFSSPKTRTPWRQRQPS